MGIPIRAEALGDLPDSEAQYLRLHPSASVLHQPSKHEDKHTCSYTQHPFLKKPKVYVRML